MTSFKKRKPIRTKQIFTILTIRTVIKVTRKTGNKI